MKQNKMFYRSIWNRGVLIGICGIMTLLLASPSYVYAQDAESVKDDAACWECHPVEADSLSLTAHVKDGTAKECATCHGNVEQHLTQAEKYDNIFNPGDVGSAKSNVICLDCHENHSKDIRQRFEAIDDRHDDMSCFECHKIHMMAPETSEDLPYFKTDLSVDCADCHMDQVDELEYSSHGDANIQCKNCHKLHEFKTVSENIESQLKKCLSCHPRQDLEFKYPSVHPLRERQVGCTDCHNPHSSEHEAMLREEEEKTCEKCHADIIIQSGSHPKSQNTNHPFKTVTCMECHEAHGSNFDKILKHDINVLCSTCHN